MVSLGSDTRRSGGFFFDQPAQSLQDTEDLLGESYGSLEEIPFKPVKTVWVTVISIILTVSLEITVFLVPDLCSTGAGSKCGISPISIVVYTHASWWFLYMLIDRYLRYQHATSRLCGYLTFYMKTRNVRRIPLLVFSGGSAMLLVLVVILNDYCGTTTATMVSDSMCICAGLPLSKCNFLQMLVSVEVAIMLPTLILYLVWTIKFNREQPTPDVHHDDSMSAFIQAQTHTSDVGFRDETVMDDILEKQADLIRYLKEHNAHLGKKVLKLTAQLSARS